jgi:hypothetical protein
MPVFHNAEIGFARGEHLHGNTYRFRIFDTSQARREREARRHRLADLRREERQFLNIRSLQIDKEYRQKGNGYGESVVASMLASNKANGTPSTSSTSWWCRKKCRAR